MLTDTYIKIDACADDCKASIIQTMGKYDIEIEETDLVLKKIMRWIEWVLED